MSRSDGAMCHDHTVPCVTIRRCHVSRSYVATCQAQGEVPRVRLGCATCSGLVVPRVTIWLCRMSGFDCATCRYLMMPCHHLKKSSWRHIISHVSSHISSHVSILVTMAKSSYGTLMNFTYTYGYV